jgi:hypothetical protein
MVGVEYNFLMSFWDKFSPQSYAEFGKIPYEIWGKIQEYKEAEVHGQKRLENNSKTS